MGDTEELIKKLFDYAQKCRNIGGYHRAIQSYDKAIEINPKSADAYYYKGTAYFALRQYSDAIKYINLALEFDPKCFQYIQTLSLVEEVMKGLDLLGDTSEI